MKIRFKNVIIFIFFLCISTLSLLFSQQDNFYFGYDKNSDKVEIVENGIINWSQNYVIAKASGELSLSEQKDYSYMEAVIEATGERSLENLLGVMKVIKIDDYRTITDIIHRNREARNKLSLIFKESAKILEPIFITNTKFEVNARIPIYGENSISSALYSLFPNTGESLLNNVDTSLSLRNHRYSKIIIDARFMGYNPSIFPEIYYKYDTNNNGYEEKVLFYSPKIISESNRDNNLYIKYFTDPFLFKDEIWVSYKSDYNIDLAYFTSALYVEGELNTDIIISKEDAFRLLSRRENIETILNGNLYLLVD